MSLFASPSPSRDMEFNPAPFRGDPSIPHADEGSFEVRRTSFVDEEGVSPSLPFPVSLSPFAGTPSCCSLLTSANLVSRRFEL